MVDSIPSAVILVDKQGAISFSNKETHRMFGYTGSELADKPVEVLIPERFANKHLSFRNMFLNAPQTRSMGAGRELFALRKDKTEFPVEIGLNSFAAADDDLVLASIIDISERLCCMKTT